MDVFLDIENRFSYHPPTPVQVVVYEEMRERARNLADWIATVFPVSRERALALTHLEETVMWANAALARHDLGQ